MSMVIHKSGLLDTLQDAGRYGNQHLGINTGGVMDATAMQLANALVGNAPHEALLEMHFPAAEISFTRNTYIALAGADFSAKMNGRAFPLLQPVLVNKGSVLRFTRKQKGERVYLAIRGGFVATEWLDSYSTHLKVRAGGFKGRALQKQDRLETRSVETHFLSDPGQPFEKKHWGINASELYHSGPLLCIAGAEYGLLETEAKRQLEEDRYRISPQSDRMGYRIEGEPLRLEKPKEMISTGVTRGTLQLLPDGQLIILMADHQTTGGYPRIGHVISTYLPTLAQMGAGERFTLSLIDIAEAEKYLALHERNLARIRNGCSLHWKSVL